MVRPLSFLVYRILGRTKRQRRPLPSVSGDPWTSRRRREVNTGCCGCGRATPWVTRCVDGFEGMKKKNTRACTYPPVKGAHPQVGPRESLPILRESVGSWRISKVCLVELWTSRVSERDPPPTFLVRISPSKDLMVHGELEDLWDAAHDLEDLFLEQPWGLSFIFRSPTSELWITKILRLSARISNSQRELVNP